jgi:hypothetical protein
MLARILAVAVAVAGRQRRFDARWLGDVGFDKEPFAIRKVGGSCGAGGGSRDSHVNLHVETGLGSP